jgi:asparagine synthetase B (glutamine-hydrolysing)
MDVDRIHTRNLGRDDRIISSHGKEARYPFLSMTLLSYLSSVPVHLKVDPRVIGIDPNNEETDLHAEGHSLILRGLPGDKLLHRLAARELGLWSAAGRAKRAMQFGSRSARMEGGELGKKSRSGTDLA